MKRTTICVLFSIFGTSTAGSSTAPPYDVPRTRSFSPPAIEPVGSIVGDAGVDFEARGGVEYERAELGVVVPVPHHLRGGRPLGGDRARARARARARRGARRARPAAGVGDVAGAGRRVGVEVEHRLAGAEDELLLVVGEARVEDLRRVPPICARRAAARG